MIKVYLYIVVETQDIGVHLFASYKIVLLPQFFKEQIWDDLWITNKIKKISKWTLTDEKRADLNGEKYVF